jgi:hypothetical protein
LEVAVRACRGEDGNTDATDPDALSQHTAVVL